MDDHSNAANYLPILPEQITASWLAKKLQRQIISIAETRPANHGTGSKLFFTATQDDGSTIKICLKGGFNPAMREQAAFAIPWWINEARFFQTIAASLPFLEPPQFFWAGSDSRQGIVIMADLAAEGYTFGDPSSPRTVAEVMTGVEQLAGLHSATWGKTGDDFPWLAGQPHYLDVVLPSLGKDQWNNYFGDSTRPIPDSMLDQARTEAVFAKYKRIRNPRFRALLHGDAHLANTYYKPGARGELRFLDWQLYFTGSVFHDVSYFIASSLSIEDRRKHENAVLDHYLQCLTKLGDGNIPAFKRTDEDVWDEYRKSFLSGFGWFCTPYVMQPPERVHPMIERYAAAIEEHAVFELVESLPDVHSP